MEERVAEGFYFRQLRKVNIGDTAVGAEARYSLLCVSNEFGLTFVGCSKGVYVFVTAALHAVDEDENIGSPSVMADLSHLQPALLPTLAPPLSVALSCDDLTLAVHLREGGYPRCLFYDTRALTAKGQPIQPFTSITLTTQQGVSVLSLRWNPSPAHGELLAISLSNGTLELLQVKDDVSLVSRKEGVHANAICWSPKGKQLAVGRKDGTLIQFNKTLEVKKAFPCPNIFNGVPHQVSDFHWVSTYMFAMVYTPLSPTDSTPSLVFLSAPKDNPLVFTNCQDVYYGNGNKQNKFYFNFISTWGVLISSSTNALESVVFAQRGGGDGEGVMWEKWELEDTGRVEMPLDENHDETFAAGMAISLTSQVDVRISESTTLPPSPILLMYSDHGVLCPYTIINTGCPPSEIQELVSPPKPLPTGPIRQPVRQGGEAHAQIHNQPPSTASPLQQPSQAVPTPLQQQQQQQQQLLASLGRPPGTLPPPPPPPATTQVQGPGLGLQTPMPSAPITQPGPFAGLNLGGMKFGSTLGQQPSFMFNVGALTSTQPQETGKASLPTPMPSTISATTASPDFAALARRLGTQPPGQSVLTGIGHTSQTGIPSLTGHTSQTGIPSLTGHTSQTEIPSLTGHTSQTGMPGFTGQTGQTGGLQLGQFTLASMLGQPKATGGHTAPPPPYVPPTQPTPTSTALPSYSAPRPPPSTSQLPLPPPPPSSSTAPTVKPFQGLQLATTQQGIQQQPFSQQTAAMPILPPPSSQPPSNRALTKSGPMPPPIAGLSVTRPPPPYTTGSLNQSIQLGQLGTPPLLSSTPLAAGGPVASRPPMLGTMPSQVPPQGGQQLATLIAPPPITPMTIPTTRAAVPRMSVPVSQPQRAVVGPQKQLPSSAVTGAPVLVTQGDNEPDAENIEASFSGDIQKEIDEFADELEEMKTELSDLFGGWEGWRGEDGKVEGLGSMEAMRELREMTQKTETTVQDITQTLKKVDRKSSQLGDDILRGFELGEKARANLKKKNNPNYATLLKLRPLDAYSARILNEIRSSFLQVEQGVGEVNSQLDAERERREEEKRLKGRSPLKAPTVQTVYSTLRNHRQIARMQSTRMERLADQMKKLQLIPHSWHPSDVLDSPPPPLRAGDPSRVRNTSQYLSGLAEDERPQRKTLEPEKLEKLRDFLSSIERTPVRRARTARFVYPAERSGTGTPISSQLPGTETPPEEAFSVADSEIASTVDEQALEPPSQPPPLHHSQPPISVPLQYPPPPHGETQTSRLPAPSLTPHPSASSLLSTTSSRPDVILTPDQKIKVSTAEGYKVTSSPVHAHTQPPITVQSGTVHWGSPTAAGPPIRGAAVQPPSVRGAIQAETRPQPLLPSTTGIGLIRSMEHPHTVGWGTPPTTTTFSSGPPKPPPSAMYSTPPALSQPFFASTSSGQFESLSVSSKVQPSLSRFPGQTLPAHLVTSVTNSEPPILNPSTSPLFVATQSSSQAPVVSTGPNPGVQTLGINLSASPLIPTRGASPPRGIALGPPGTQNPLLAESKAAQEADSSSIATVTTTTSSLTAIFAGMPTFSSVRTDFTAGIGSSPFKFGSHPSTPFGTPSPSVPASFSSSKADSQPPIVPLSSFSFSLGGTFPPPTIASTTSTASALATTTTVGSLQVTASTTSSKSTASVASATSGFGMSIPSFSASPLNLPSLVSGDKKEEAASEDGKEASQAEKSVPTTIGSQIPQDTISFQKTTIQKPAGIFSSAPSDDTKSISGISKPGVGLSKTELGSESPENTSADTTSHLGQADHEATPTAAEVSFAEKVRAETKSEGTTCKAFPEPSGEIPQPEEKETKQEDPKASEEKPTNTATAEAPSSSLTLNFPLPLPSSILPTLPVSTTSAASTVIPASISAIVASATPMTQPASTATFTDTTKSDTATKVSFTSQPQPSHTTTAATQSQPISLTMTSTHSTGQIQTPTSVSQAQLGSSVGNKQLLSSPGLSLLRQPQLTGSHSSLQSAETEDLEMDGMGDMDNGVEPIDTNGSDQLPAGVPMGGMSFGLGTKVPTNVTANPFGSTGLTGAKQTPASGLFQNKPGHGILKPATMEGSFGQASQLSTSSGGSMGGGLGVGMAATAPQFGTAPVLGSTSPGTMFLGGGMSFGGGPSFGQQPAFVSPPQLNTGALEGRIFGMQSGLGPGGTQGSLFGGQQYAAGGGMSFGNLAQQQQQEPQGFMGGRGLGMSSDSMGGSQFSNWRN